MKTRRPAALILIAAGMLCLAFGCSEKPKYADPAEAQKADEGRIRAIQNNPNLTQAQKDWQINRIKGQMPQQSRK